MLQAAHLSTSGLQSSSDAFWGRPLSVPSTQSNLSFLSTRHLPFSNLPAVCSSLRTLASIQGASPIDPVSRRPPSNEPTLFKVTAKVTVRRKRNQSVSERLVEQIDSISDSAGQKVFLQLVSAELDQNNGRGKRSNKAALKDWSEKVNIRADKVQYTADFIISKDFGLPGAITILNGHQNEFFLETIALEGLPNGTVYFSCYSWVQSRLNVPQERTFFSNQSYLPSQTPAGLKHLREMDMKSLRGDGKGTRKACDRIYDYATYNDIGNPDKSEELARPTIGGTAKFPYPRRCRTGRSPTKTDATAESVLEMGTNYYVPRDEAFEQIKQETFIGNSLKGVIHQLVPALMDNFKEQHGEFQCFQDIDRLYQEGIKLRKSDLELDFLKTLPIAPIIKQVEDTASQVSGLLRYTQPDLVSKDKFAWTRDDEFGREVLAGANPLKVERLQVFPPRSALDPSVFGPQESAIKTEDLEQHLGGLTVEQAMQDNRLFLLDYHDAYMPFINKVNALEGRKMYASRTILFRTDAGTLTPIAIELSLPPSPSTSGSQRVFTPGQHGSSFWKWQLAKAHVSSNDAGFHQLVNHWLRSHATVEPYVIATHRQLSSMHPISKLLLPHFRYTLEINASARQLLINADGVIENCFTPGPYSLEISSAAYDSFWRFDQEALPADLIRRGMAVEDASQPNGLKLMIEDYPYAADGMLIWNSIKSWVDEYVSLYYSDSQSVCDDLEIQRWWDEIKNKGHADKKNEEWWPELKTREDLQSILTTIIWIVSGFHAAVNFGQYAYGGYVPNRPCMTRRFIPEEGTPEYEEFIRNPEKFFLSTIPNQLQATTTMAVVDTLSSHSPDEEYLGERVQTNWTADTKAVEASLRFLSSVKAAEKMINQRNHDSTLKNRTGAGVLPYELLMPTSGPGLTGRGVPNSISI